MTFTSLSDCLGAAVVHEDDNSKLAMYFTQLRVLARTIGRRQRSATPAVLCVHHPLKRDLRKPRGAGAIQGNPDTVIAAAEGRGVVTLEVQKQRQGPRGPLLSYRLRPIDKGQRQPDWSDEGPYAFCEFFDAGTSLLTAYEPDARAERCLAALLPHGAEGLSDRDWRATSGVPGGSFDRTKHELLQAGRVRKGDGHRGKFIAVVEGEGVS